MKNILGLLKFKKTKKHTKKRVLVKILHRIEDCGRLLKDSSGLVSGEKKNKNKQSKQRRCDDEQIGSTTPLKQAAAGGIPGHYDLAVAAWLLSDASHRGTTSVPRVENPKLFPCNYPKKHSGATIL